MTYLSQLKGNWPPGFWDDFYSQRGNPVPIRIAGLNGMEELGLLEEKKALLSQVVQNPHEAAELRKSSLLTASRIFASSELEKELTSIFTNPENSLEMRRFSLDNLAASGNGTLVSKLRQLLAREKNPILSKELEALAETLTSKS